ncbi:hypothetical protein V1478_008173 [Vespula squamosa]|uniref:Uncharacterized protein n=1 Tax=Vespula squamosa TaxID=30214 RepID=A0ABD2AZW3_VESSQ
MATGPPTRKGSTNARRTILFIILGQDAPRAKDQQRLCTNERRIILFVVLGQDARRASINEDFKVSEMPRGILSSLGSLHPGGM